MAPGTGDEAVTPVVGSILILVIMIMAIGGIVAFGVPIINGLQDYAEFQNVVTQYQELDADVRNLRDPQNVRVSAISINKGEIALSTGDRWVITVVEAGADKAFLVSDWEIADDVNNDGLTITPELLGGAKYYVHEVRGSTFISVSDCTGGASTCALTNIDLDTDVVRIQMRNAANDVKGEAWILNVGRLSFRQSPTSELNQVHYELGAVMTEQDDAFFIQQVPTIKEPDAGLADYSLFVRLLRLQVDIPTTVSGQGRHTVVTNLVDNYGEARGRPAFDNVDRVRIQVDGPMEEAFCNYFNGRSNLGWKLNPGTDCETGADLETVHVIFDRVGVDGEDDPDRPDFATLRFDLIHSEVDADLRSI
ncbi:MAG: hypothetical protein HYT80_03335 [Euryarchaeota archaeon]|nr:hypothetical protein [Euryarchaeota archaeon]